MVQCIFRSVILASVILCGGTAYSCPLVNTNLVSLKEIKDKILDDSTADFPNFCKWNRMDRFSKQFTSDIQKNYQQLKNKNNIDGAAQLLASHTSEEQGDIWSLSMAGHPIIKNLANDKSFLVNCVSQGFPKCSPATNSDLMSAMSKPFQNNSLQIPEYKPIKDQKTSSAIMRVGACSLFSDSSISECSKNLSQIENLMVKQDFVADQNAPRPFAYKEPPPMMSFGLGSSEMPFTSSMVTAAPIVKKILTDAAATEGLRRAALKMLEMEKKGVPSGSNAFDDIKKSFEEAGLTSKEANDKAWDTMAALASAGPNFAKRWSRESLGHRMDIKNINDNPNAFALQVIAEAMPKLDTTKSSHQNGALYSLPNGINFPCDIGKSYHFWMTAYLARNLTQSGSDPKSASSSAYIADLGYQMNRESFAGSSLNMNSVERFGSTENGLRMDLVLAAGGAKFGVADAQNKKYSADLTSNYKTALKQSPDDSWNLRSEAEKLLPGFAGKAVTFIDRIRPATIFDSFN